MLNGLEDGTYQFRETLVDKVEKRLGYETVHERIKRLDLEDDANWNDHSEQRRQLYKKNRQQKRCEKIYNNLEAYEKRAIINKAYDEIAKLINQGFNNRAAANIVNKRYSLRISETTVPRKMAQGQPLVYRDIPTRIAKHVEERLANWIINQRNDD